MVNSQWSVGHSDLMSQGSLGQHCNPMFDHARYLRDLFRVIYSLPAFVGQVYSSSYQSCDELCVLRKAG